MMTNQDSTRPATGGPPVAQQRSADWAHRLHDPVVGRVPAIDFERAGGVDLDRLERSPSDVDLRGGLIAPGFVDAHVHTVQGGLERIRCDLSELNTRQE